MKILAIAVTIAAVAMFGADNTIGSDNTIGTWTLKIDPTKSTGPKALKSYTSKREAIDGGVKVTNIGEMGDGTRISSSYTAKYDGKDYPATGAQWDSISLKLIDPNTITFETKKGGIGTKGKTVVSEDGKTMSTYTESSNRAFVLERAE
ncbi:MAG: hypothetical protein M3N41_14705 [Acidobacteriota bacterium]|nr:hypothetical protein [Acidobacteriota bacterium]